VTCHKCGAVCTAAAGVAVKKLGDNRWSRILKSKHDRHSALDGARQSARACRRSLVLLQGRMTMAKGQMRPSKEKKKPKAEKNKKKKGGAAPSPFAQTMASAPGSLSGRKA
jgi:hypothetical protein